MNSIRIPPPAFQFLDQLKQHNNREWFAENKSAYLSHSASIAAVANELLQLLHVHDQIETPSGAKSLYRIYRDVRFSKDKTPYSTYWGGRFKRAGKRRRGGYYYHLEPGGKSFVLSGFWAPNAGDLKLIRDDLAFDPSGLQAVISDPVFVQEFGVLQGERLKKGPAGYDRDHTAIDLLRLKQFLVMRRFTDEEVLGGGFIGLASEAFKRMRPFLDYMSEVLSAVNSTT